MRRLGALGGALGRSLGHARRPSEMTPRARVACVLIGFAALLALGVFQVSRRRAIVEIGYELGRTTAALQRLDEEERRLNLELSVLTAPARIERLAGELGMVRPSPTSIRTVRATRSLARVAR